MSDTWTQVCDLTIPFAMTNWCIVADAAEHETCGAIVPWSEEVDEDGHPEAVGPCERDGYALVELQGRGVTVQTILCELHHEMLLEAS